jgi:hypothetical protein
MTTLQQTAAIAERAARAIAANDGATLAVKAGQADPTTGYVVANGRDEQTTDLAKFAARWEIEQYIGAYVDAHRSALAQTGAYLGAWIDDGYLVLDVVSVLPERNVALNLARDNGERAIFNLSTGETLWTADYFPRGYSNSPARRLLDSHN